MQGFICGLHYISHIFAVLHILASACLATIVVYQLFSIHSGRKGPYEQNFFVLWSWIGPHIVASVTL